MLQRKVYSGCSRCEAVLQRSEWLLEPTDWKLEELGSGGNGQVYKATCVETGCEHAAKFLSYNGGKWESTMLARAHRSQSRHIVRTICAGPSRNPAGQADKGVRPQFVIISELMSEDLFSAVFEPCWLSKSLFAKGCALKHIAYQLFQSIQGK
jgi:serine/threonine protein kinase